MAASKVDLKRVLLLDWMCGVIAARIYGGKWRLVQEQMASSLGSGLVTIM